MGAGEASNGRHLLGKPLDRNQLRRQLLVRPHCSLNELACLGLVSSSEFVAVTLQEAARSEGD